MFGSDLFIGANTVNARLAIRERYKQSEPEIVGELLAESSLSDRERHMLSEQAASIVKHIRQHSSPGIMESFLGEYGLSTDEGVGLMCLAEALLRVPDSETIDELIADKIEPSNWGEHLGQSSSSLVNASTWALLITGRLLDDTDTSNENTNAITALRQLIRRLGEPVVRTAVSQAMKLLGKQFVLGQTIEEAIDEAQSWQSKGYTYSYDMLGEAARTYEDATRYFDAYAHAIKSIASVPGNSVAEKPGISIKLSALHPRYEYAQYDAVMSELVPRALALVDMAAQANIGLNIDAEEADRLDLSLDIIDALLQHREHQHWNGFGVVIQAYSRRALPVIDWLTQQCRTHERKMMVRLVKGAYWDAEIKQAQELGLKNFPVYTRKAHTDLSYIVCAQRLLDNRDIIYPQFATHNAHTVCAIRYLAGADTSSYEFQRLHGMGDALHDYVLQQHGTRCRIYAPVGAHVDLLAYLVRRLLENGANSSFVNQIVNTDLSPEAVSQCPIDETRSFTDTEHPLIRKPLELFSPERTNSKGYRINDPASIQALLDTRDQFRTTQWQAEPITVPVVNTQSRHNVVNPANSDDIVGSVGETDPGSIASVVDAASAAYLAWQDTPVATRAKYLQKTADLFEHNIAELCAILSREAGKSLADAIAEVREAVDFLRYYSVEANKLSQQQSARGLIVCISPWNFPLAIFSGQISAALSVGNVVIAKPAQQTPLIAAYAVNLFHQAGVPVGALQLLPGDGASVGNTLVSHPGINGVCFTGSTGVAQHINATLANRTVNKAHSCIDPDPMLIAETGGINAMIIDTTALTEQVVRDVLISSFQSAGQRCSALRILYIQEEAEERLLTMLSGAIDTLKLGDPWQLSTDVGPVIDESAKKKINEYVNVHINNGNVIKRADIPDSGTFCSPTIIRVSGIEDMSEEIFGPVLHVATYRADELDKVIDAINSSGYGLTFGLHSRIDDRVQHIVERIHAGNVYINRNQIGAIVGSQPFGGEGMSGTGPKAGGPHYLQRFLKPINSLLQDSETVAEELNSDCDIVDKSVLESSLSALSLSTSENEINHWILPGPTGESNRLSTHPVGRVLVIASDKEAARLLALEALASNCAVLVVCSESAELNIEQDALSNLATSEQVAHRCVKGLVKIEDLESLQYIDAVAFAGATRNALQARQALARRAGKIIPFVSHTSDGSRFMLERHVCVDTTAAGGNASLLASAE